MFNPLFPARSHSSFARYALIEEFGCRGMGQNGHRDDRADSVAQTVMADRSDQQPAESNVLTGSHNQELRVPGLPHRNSAWLAFGELKEPIRARRDVVEHLVMLATYAAP
jgi:hypothetical protein